MSVKRQQIPITSPCPITLDRSGVQTEDRELFCAHCSKDVHLLSHMTEREAREFMRSRAGEDICVSYSIRSDGQIRFRPEPQLIPRTALVRAPALRRSLSMAASIGAAALISACTPHEAEGEAAAKTQVETEQVEVEVEVETPPEPPPVAGGLTAEPLPEEPCDPKEDIQVDGGLRAEPIDPPPEIGIQPKQKHVAGGLRAQPIDPSIELEQDP